MSAERFDAIENREKGLRRGLTSAQLTMIAIGGAIGTGQFRHQFCRPGGNPQLCDRRAHCAALDGLPG
jgi:hypothetical protein